MAAVDYFLKIEGIDGESAAKGQENTIELESFSWGATNHTTPVRGGKGLGAGKASLEDVHFTTKASKASPKVMLACCTGEHLKQAVLTCRKAGKEQQEYYKITFTNVLVSSFQISGNIGDHDADNIVPTEHFSLSFGAIAFDYKPQKPDGTLGASVKASFDAATGHAV